MNCQVGTPVCEIVGERQRGVADTRVGGDVFSRRTREVEDAAFLTHQDPGFDRACHIPQPGFHVGDHYLHLACTGHRKAQGLSRPLAALAEQHHLIGYGDAFEQVKVEMRHGQGIGTGIHHLHHVRNVSDRAGSLGDTSTRQAPVPAR